MKRAIISMAITGVVLSLLVVVSGSKSRLSVVPSVYAATGCSNATLKGAYGFKLEGWNTEGPFAGVGVAVFHGDGTATLRETAQLNGTTISDMFADAPGNITYSVKPNCTAKFMHDDGSVFLHEVIVDGGKEAFFIIVTDGATNNGVARKITGDED